VTGNGSLCGLVSAHMKGRTDGWLPKGLRIHGKAQLLQALAEWLGESDAPTIGDTSTFHGRYWVSVQVGGYRVKVAADTTRGAVRRVVEELQRNPGRPWHVKANQKGRINKVILTERAEPGWYAYLGTPLDAEASI
jgi:hypothetical protein